MRPATRAGSGCTFSATKMKKIITSTGMARKNSTSSVASQRTGRWSESRPVASTAPSASESTDANAKALRVLPSPAQQQVLDALVLEGRPLAEVNWSVSKSR